jgi:CBS domain-containing protein
MRRRVPTTTATETAASAWERMRVLRVSYLIVLRGSDVVGTLARHDLSGPGGGAHRRMGRTVGDLMHAAAVTIGPDTSVARAAALMRTRDLGCLPVVEREKVVGMLTMYEMLGILARSRARVGARDAGHS